MEAPAHVPMLERRGRSTCTTRLHASLIAEHVRPGDRLGPDAVPCPIGYAAGASARRRS